ncbi:hypothetical protein T492DRAFT_883669, partial [Pavlovales sp. CCMP2436]
MREGHGLAPRLLFAAAAARVRPDDEEVPTTSLGELPLFADGRLGTCTAAGMSAEFSSIQTPVMLFPNADVPLPTRAAPPCLGTGLIGTGVQFEGLLQEGAQFGSTGLQLSVPAAPGVHASVARTQLLHSAVVALRASNNEMQALAQAPEPLGALPPRRAALGLAAAAATAAFAAATRHTLSASRTDEQTQNTAAPFSSSPEHAAGACLNLRSVGSPPPTQATKGVATQPPSVVSWRQSSAHSNGADEPSTSDRIVATPGSISIPPRALPVPLVMRFAEPPTLLKGRPDDVVSDELAGCACLLAYGMNSVQQLQQLPVQQQLQLQLQQLPVQQQLQLQLQQQQRKQLPPPPPVSLQPQPQQLQRPTLCLAPLLEGTDYTLEAAARTALAATTKAAAGCASLNKRLPARAVTATCGGSQSLPLPLLVPLPPHAPQPT